MQTGSGPLEDRLRNLILTNSDPGCSPSAKPQPVVNLPTGEHGMESHKEQAPQAQTPGKGGRKRPNQAQRRQMNAELSIPIDPRPAIPPSSFGHYQQHNKYRNGDRTQYNSFQSHGGTYPENNHNQGSIRANDGYPSPAQFHQDHAHSSVPSRTQNTTWRHQQYHNHIEPSSRDLNTVPPNPSSSHNGRFQSRPQHTLYNPGGYKQSAPNPEHLAKEIQFLDRICHPIVAGAEIGPDEINEKENFRSYVEAICRTVMLHHQRASAEANLDIQFFDPETVQLKCFGSLASGFATKAADMDLGLLSPNSQQSPDSPESPIPRLIEKALLDAGFGARLLTRTRVPIIKLCEKPHQLLRQSLLDARRKWELGIVEDDRDAEEEEAIDENGVPQLVSAVLDDGPKKASNDPQHSESHFDSMTVRTEDDLLSSHKQSSEQSLNSYYSNTKRLLRRLNGRDITQANSKDFNDGEFAVLDRVAYAFVSGLHDPELRDRILQYPSFNVGDRTRVVNFRSLFGVYEMVEGEMLVMAWEQRPLLMSHPTKDHDFFRVVGRWKGLQTTKSFGDNPVWFNKELQLAVDSLRRIPSIQLMRLQQDSYESPASYHARTQAIIVDLTGGPSRTLVDVHPQIIQYFVSGINNKQIRGEVNNFVQTTKTQNLRIVARKHKALHLALEYERAVEKGLYSTSDTALITHYVSVLRRQPLLNAPGGLEYLIPMFQNEKHLVESMESLADPSTLGPNKPRDRYHDSLEFPKTGVGVQCDINFSAHLALQNTLLLRCYSFTDPRVRPLVLFVKHWAKARDINTPYRGTLSSYGYVLMVLHYLVNVVEPFVCPNLQQLAPPDPPHAQSDDSTGITTCQGRDIRFWRDEHAIHDLAQQGQLNQNSDSLGMLLRGFFEYYAQTNLMSTVPTKRGFDWGRDVLSLRTFGGLRSKSEKGWTGAKTVLQLQTGTSFVAETDTPCLQSPPHFGVDNFLNKFSKQPLPSSTSSQTAADHSTKLKEVKEVRHRFLFAIEDPFELDHNVARTVTHNGIVAIRDEFRRAWRIIKSAGRTGQATEDLLEDVKLQKEQLERKQFISLLKEIHDGPFDPNATVSAGNGFFATG
ncbi:hypothetical protein F5Y16DRAFT_175766 [Xylariaceae sp. FL0255]|nr:hypothetical protein F5Y16DRAFT_175766 [Xylariaceae sp. FL0255]